MTETPSDAGAELWAGDRVTRWLRQAPGLERQLAPVSTALFAAAQLAPGEAVLDVGCGTGPTTREAAGFVGPAGRITGLDVSGDMLAAAARATDEANVDWVEADAVTWTPPDGRYDVVLSRFGVMFFTDPDAAAHNLALATRAGGRLTAAVWGPRPSSPLFEVPYGVAVAVCRQRGQLITDLPPDGGPFSWHDAVRVTTMLESAGWHDVDLAPQVVRLPFAGGLQPAAAAAAAVDFGPTRTILTEADDDTVAATQSALTEAFAEHTDAAGHVVLDAEIRIVTARR